MEIKTVIRQLNNAFHAEVALSENGLSPSEAEAINQVGAPYVNCGGEFGLSGTTGATGTNTYFELADNYKYFPTNFPVKQIFSLTDYPYGTTAPPNAERRAIVWKDAVVLRTQDAVRTARETAGSTAVGTIIQNLDTTP